MALIVVPNPSGSMSIKKGSSADGGVKHPTQWSRESRSSSAAVGEEVVSMQAVTRA
jgi:hypothetical protein